MLNIQRQCLFSVAMLACLLCLFFLPVSVCSQNIQSATPPPSSGNTSDGASQKNEIDGFFAKFNGCAWYRIPYDPSLDMYLELKDRTLILYEYLKDQFCCLITSSICFTQTELWKMKATGYETMLFDGRGNFLPGCYKQERGNDHNTRHRQGQQQGILIDTFVKYFCSDNI
ncbi:MAG: hypothetical protein NT010_05135 [Proteobacteria bacterium]|nr:hypothetical protein [Pseudomonadota bacterium]